MGAAREVERAVARRSTEGTAELGQVLTGLLKEQAQHNVETWFALTAAVDWEQVKRAVDWKQVAEIQTGFLRVSMERMAADPALSRGRPGRGRDGDLDRPASGRQGRLTRLAR